MKNKAKDILSMAKGKVDAFKSAYMTALAAVTIFFAEAEGSYAAGGIGETIKSGLNSVYTQIFAIVTPLFALIVVIGCARIFVNNGRKVDGILDWLKRALIAYIAILLIAEIIGFIKGLAGGGSQSILNL